MPRRSASPPGPQEDHSAAADCALVLVIDDDPLLLRALSRILRGDGYLVAAATTPLEIGLALEDADLAVVLLDFFMGSQNGLDVLEQIKRDRPEVEVVVMTGQPSIDGAVGCMRRGAFDYLSKPFSDLARLRSALRRALEGASHTGRTRVPAADQPSRHILPPLRDFSSGSTPAAGAASNAARREPSPYAWSSRPLAVADPRAQLPVSLDAYERLALERALELCGGDATRAARLLGIGRSTFYRKAAKHGLTLQRSESSASRRGSEPDEREAGRVGRSGPIG